MAQLKGKKAKKAEVSHRSVNSNDHFHRKPGRTPREKDPRLIERARRVYYMIRFQGISFAAAWRTCNPSTTASGQQCSSLGRRDYNWYAGHFQDDIAAAKRANDIDSHRILRKLSEKLDARRPVLVGGCAKKNAKGEPIEVEDNGTQLRALALAVDICGLRKQEATDQLPTMIIVKVPIINKPPGGFD